MYVNYIYNELKKMYKYIIKQDDSIILSNYEVFPGKFVSEFECNKNGVFVEERGEEEQIVDFEDINLNLFGLYCILYNNKIISKELIANKLNTKSVDEIKNLFLSVFPHDYLHKNLNFDLDNTNDYALCVFLDDQYYSFCIKCNDMLCEIGICSNDISKMYKKCFEYLYSKYVFEKNVLSNININSLSERDLLKLYGYFIAKKNVPIIDIEKKSKLK